ncbi:hypothetical protein [Streptomyces sp. NPDC055189]
MKRQSRTPLATATILDGHHTLAVRRLKQHDDSFTVHYTITPPLPDGDDDAPVLLALEATDDVGNEYLDWGGAYGTAPDGTYTDGSITGQPSLAAAAGEVRVRIIFLRGGRESACTLTLPVPSARG